MKLSERVKLASQGLFYVAGSLFFTGISIFLASTLYFVPRINKTLVEMTNTIKQLPSSSYEYFLTQTISGITFEEGEPIFSNYFFNLYKGIPELQRSAVEYASSVLSGDYPRREPSDNSTVSSLELAILFESDQNKREGLIDSSWARVENYNANKGDYSSELAANFAYACSRLTSDTEKRTTLMNTAADIYTTLAEKLTRSNPEQAAEFSSFAQALMEDNVTSDTIYRMQQGIDSVLR